jgi:hypothetical protein
MNDEILFEEMAQRNPGGVSPAPASLKARLYTRLIHEQQQSGPLATVTESKLAGRGLCVFEELVQITPVGAPLKSKFYCDVCHARVLAEHLDNPPIWWPNCPYAQVKNS